MSGKQQHPIITYTLIKRLFIAYYEQAALVGGILLSTERANAAIN